MILCLEPFIKHLIQYHTLLRYIIFVNSPILLQLIEDVNSALENGCKKIWAILFTYQSHSSVIHMVSFQQGAYSYSLFACEPIWNHLSNHRQRFKIL